MRRLSPLLAAIPVLTLAAAAPASPDRRAPPPATPIGEPVTCIQTSRIQDTQVHGDRTIDFRMRGGPVLRNTLPDDCPMLGQQRGFSYTSTADQLCAIDTIRVLPAGGGVPGPTCGLGTFQPIELVGTAR